MILQGDALEELRKLPDKCCSVCVTSPPYYNARDYGAADQLGTESSPEEYTRKLVEAFREVARVLKDDGTLWLNIGDSYARHIEDGGIKRNSDWTEETRYSSDLSEMKYRANLAAKGADLKIGNDHRLAEYIETKIADEKYSPEAVLGEIKAQGLQFNTEIKSKNTIYSYIEKGIFLRLTNKNLPVKGDKKRSYHKVQTQKRAPKGESIEKRPEIIGERSTFGHWEMDTVVSARPGKAAILVLTERLTRNEITAKLPDKSAASVVQALDDLEKEWGELFPRVFQTITVDNGSEFADCPGIERSILAEGSRTKCYYCHPYSSYERGSNENLNKMIRRWLPKGTNFDEIGAEVIQTITNWLNNYPRKILGFLPASAVFQEQMDALLGA